MSRTRPQSSKRHFISRKQLIPIIFVVLVVAIVLLRLLVPLLQLAS